MEIRALAIAFFYAIGTAIGGITGPLVFQKLGESGDVGQVMIAYLIGAAVMAVGGIVEIFLGVPGRAAARSRTSRSRSPLKRPRRARRRGREGPEAEKGVERPDADEAERRHRARAERERRGLRRWRPGRGAASYSPFFPPPVESRPDWLDREVEMIERALADHGELARDELARRVGARYWGPGRFRGALREAVAEGAARRVHRNSYRPRRPRHGEEPPDTPAAGEA